MNTKNKVFKNSILYTFSSLLMKGVEFLLLPIYTIYLTPNDYGTINLVSSFTQVAIYVASFSLYSSVIRLYSDYKDDREKLKTFYGTIVIFVFISNCFFAGIGIFFRKTITKYLFNGINFYPIILITFATLIFICLHTVHQNILQAMQLGKKLTKINLIMFALKISLNIILIVGFKLGVVSMLITNLILNLLYCIYFIIDLKKNNLIKFKMDWKMLKISLAYSIPLMPHNLSTHIANFISRIFINTSSSLAVVGLYSVASQFGGIIDTVQMSVNKAFVPWFFDLMNKKNSSEKKEIKDISTILIIIYSLMYMIIGLFSQEMILMFCEKSYSLAWTVVPILVVAFSIKSLYYFYIDILFYHKDASKKIFIATIIGSLSDIFIAYFLVPKFGMYGSAISFLIAKLIIVLIILKMAKQYKSVGYDLKKFVKIISSSLIFMGVGLILSYTMYIEEINVMNLLYKVGIVFIYTIYLFISNKLLITQYILNTNSLNKIKRIAS